MIKTWWHDSNLLKIDKKSEKDIDISYIKYIKIKKFDDFENIHSVNPLYLIINSAIGHLKKSDKKYLILDSTDKYEEVWSGIRSEIKRLNGWKDLFYENDYARIGINTDDDLPLNKPIKFPILTVSIRCIFQEGRRMHPQIYLGECLLVCVINNDTA